MGRGAEWGGRSVRRGHGTAEAYSGTTFDSSRRTENTGIYEAGATTETTKHTAGATEVN